MFCIGMFLASSEFCQQITFAKSFDSGSKLFDTLKVFLKDGFEKVHFEKKSADDKKGLKITQ